MQIQLRCAHRSGCPDSGGYHPVILAAGGDGRPVVSSKAYCLRHRQIKGAVRFVTTREAKLKGLV